MAVDANTQLNLCAVLSELGRHEEALAAAQAAATLLVPLQASADVHSMLGKVVTSVVRPFADAQAQYEQSSGVVLPIIDELISDVQWAQDFRFAAFTTDDANHWAEPVDVPLRHGETHANRRERRGVLTRSIRAGCDDHRRFQTSAWYVQHCG